MVLLVPNRSTIYAPLLDPPRDVSASHATLDEFARNFARAGVLTVNLTPAFARDAGTLIHRNVYLYLLDDTHWSACGTAFAAEEILSVALSARFIARP